MIESNKLQTNSNTTSLDQAKVLGGIGFMLTLLGLLPVYGTVLVVAGWLLVLYALTQVSDAAHDSSIFNYGIIGAVLSVVGSIGLRFVLGVSIFGSIVSGLSNLAGYSIINNLLLLWVNAIVASIFLYMAFKRTSIQFNIGLFNAGALVYLIGEALTIILVGFLIAVVGQIILAIAFFSLPESVPLRTTTTIVQPHTSAETTTSSATVSSSGAQMVQERKFCPKCGTRLEPGASFCANCGASSSSANT